MNPDDPIPLPVNTFPDFTSPAQNSAFDKTANIAGTIVSNIPGSYTVTAQKVGGGSVQISVVITTAGTDTPFNFGTFAPGTYTLKVQKSSPGPGDASASITITVNP